MFHAQAGLPISRRHNSAGYFTGIDRATFRFGMCYFVTVQYRMSIIVSYSVTGDGGRGAATPVIQACHNIVGLNPVRMHSKRQYRLGFKTSRSNVVCAGADEFPPSVWYCPCEIAIPYTSRGSLRPEVWDFHIEIYRKVQQNSSRFLHVSDKKMRPNYFMCGKPYVAIIKNCAARYLSQYVCAGAETWTTVCTVSSRWY